MNWEGKINAMTEKKDKSNITRRGIVGRNPEGKPIFGKIKVHAGQPPSVDELPPDGVEGQLSKKPPISIGGVSARDVHESAKKTLSPQERGNFTADLDVKDD